MKKVVILTLAIVAYTASYGQITITKDGKSRANIVIQEDNNIDREAAELLQKFVKRISGAELDIIETPAIDAASGATDTSEKPSKSSKAEILIGDIALSGIDVDISLVGEDGFMIYSYDNHLRIIGADGSGTLYGVAELLERYLGVKYYAKDIYTLKESKNISLPNNIELIENPAFRFRQTHNYGTQDPDYKAWFRLEDASKQFASGLWVHTFDKILSSDEFGASNPEFFAYINGERRVGKATQWCLSNDDLLEIVASRIDSIFKANPQSNIISVSQMDGNYTNCMCDECKRITEEEGAISGPFVHFMNKLAERFPDKQISTLAYLFTMQPPKHVKPLDNVNIMLCDIDCMREVSLTENPSGQEFVEALEGWSKISNNIFIWDYGINFDNMVSPFPNFHILQDNIQLFKENNATMLFEQVNGGNSIGTDFGELRAYMLAKLMWDPYQNSDDLMREFLDGYYGEAANYLYQYLKLQEGALLDSEIGLWIYDSPVTHKDGMLKPVLMRRYNKLFDDAEAAVAHDKELLRRVRLSRLPLQYAQLEIARTQPVETIDTDKLREDVELFKARTAEYGVTSLNERANSPQDYCDIYLSRYLPSESRSLTAGAEVIYITPPTKEHYAAMGKTALVDELYGGTTFTESWVGWEGSDGEFILDMHQSKELDTIESDWLHQLGQWIFFPSRVEYYISDDGERYTLFGAVDREESQNPSVLFENFKVMSQTKQSARYIKVKFTSIKSCPSWHYGIGYPAWVFVDEVKAY